MTIILIIFFALTLSATTFAQSDTTPTSTVTQQQINELQTKIASKVAELKLVEKRGIIGTVTDSSDTTLTLNDVNGNIQNIDVDELTKFYSSTSSFGISDIKNGQTLGILGLYNKDSRRLLAREIYAMSTPSNIVIGIISDIDRVNYEITLTEENGNKVIFEIQDTTKTSVYSQKSLARSGFSKTQTEQTAVITGTPDPQSHGKFLADRVIILPNIDMSSFLKSGNIPASASASGSGLEFNLPGK